MSTSTSQDSATARHEFTSVDIADVTINLESRRRPIDPDAVNRLTDDIKAHGLLQPIGVQETADGLVVVFGAHRFLACRNARLTSIAAIRFPATTPAGDIELIEIRENLFRHDLTDAQRRAHELRYAAILKEQGDVIAANTARSKSKRRTDVREKEEKPATVIEAVATASGKSKSAVRMNAKRAAASVGEKDFSIEKATPKQLREVAAKIEAKAKEPKAPKEKKASRPAVVVKNIQQTAAPVTEGALTIILDVDIVETLRNWASKEGVTAEVVAARYLTSVIRPHAVKAA